MRDRLSGCPELRQAGALSASVHMHRDGKRNDRRGGEGFQQCIFEIIHQLPLDEVFLIAGVKTTIESLLPEIVEIWFWRKIGDFMR